MLLKEIVFNLPYSALSCTRRKIAWNSLKLDVLTLFCFSFIRVLTNLRSDDLT